MEKDSKKILLLAPALLVDRRLDSVLGTLLAERLPGRAMPSRTVLTAGVRAGLITVNDRPVKPSYLVRWEDRIMVPEEILEPQMRALPEKTDLDVPVVFENEHFLVVSKPAGLLVHPAGHSREGTLVDWLLGTRPAVKGVGEDSRRPGIVHRLDRDTSGLLVLAKTPKAFTNLKALFQGRKVKKEYHALVYGHISPASGVIAAPLIQRSGSRKRSVARGEKKSREAFTEYQLLRRYPEHDLLTVLPKTGRTHQIRVHLAHAGHPIVADPLYSFRPQKRAKTPLAERQLLHAARLSFRLFDEEYSFEAPLPRDFQEVLEKIGPPRSLEG